jgi:hypothetical protein
VKERKLIDEMLTVLDEIKLVYGDWLENNKRDQASALRD